MTTIGWDDPRTARIYESVCGRHARYREANAALVAHAELRRGHRVLDVAAGTGRTTEAALPLIGDSGRVLCVEPAGAMRDVGMRRVRDARVRWTLALPDARDDSARYDRVLCGAALWQLLPLEESIARLAALLAPGAALCFNIPSLYLREPDEPGGGRDPLLVDLTLLVERSPDSVAGVVTPATASFLHDAGEMEALLTAAGLRPRRWTFRVKLTQAGYRDWLAIPVVSEGLFAGLSPRERARRLRAAYERSDRASWRWERWTGWTAWRES